MRETIKQLFAEWTELYQHQQSDEGLSEEHHDFELEDRLHGVAIFLKKVAFACNDMELLGLAAKVEMTIERAKAEDEAIEPNADLFARNDFDAEVKKVCVLHFYKAPQFRVDMTRYQAMVEAAADRFDDAKALEVLRRYIDEKGVLDKVYLRVRDALSSQRWHAEDKRMPTLEEMQAEFAIAIKDVYRRADAHFLKTIDKHRRA